MPSVQGQLRKFQFPEQPALQCTVSSDFGVDYQHTHKMTIHIQMVIDTGTSFLRAAFNFGVETALPRQHQHWDWSWSMAVVRWLGPGMSHGKPHHPPLPTPGPPVNTIHSLHQPAQHLIVILKGDREYHHVANCHSSLLTINFKIQRTMV